MEDSCSPIKMIGDVQVWGPWDGYMGWGTSMLVFGRVGSGGQANCHMHSDAGHICCVLNSPLKPKIMWLSPSLSLSQSWSRPPPQHLLRSCASPMQSHYLAALPPSILKVLHHRKFIPCPRCRRHHCHCCPIGYCCHHWCSLVWVPQEQMGTDIESLAIFKIFKGHKPSTQGRLTPILLREVVDWLGGGCF